MTLKRLLAWVSIFVTALVVLYLNFTTLISDRTLHALARCNLQMEKENTSSSCRYVARNASYQFQFEFRAGQSRVCYQSKNYIVWMTMPELSTCL